MNVQQHMQQHMQQQVRVQVQQRCREQRAESREQSISSSRRFKVPVRVACDTRTAITSRSQHLTTASGY